MADEKTLGGEWDKRDLPDWMKDAEIPEWMLEAEKEFKAGPTKIKPVAFRQTFNIDKYIIDFLGDEPFFAGMMMQMQRVMTLSIPTMAVSFARDQFTLLINPMFVESLHSHPSGCRQNDIHSVLIHENLHPCNDHLTIRWIGGRHTKAWAWATDMENNSTIVHQMKRSLPFSPIVPGLRPGMPFNIKLDPPKPEHTEAFKAWMASPPSPLELAVMRAPQFQAAEFYYNLILPHMLEEDASGKASGPPGDEPGTDDHDVWGDPSDAGETPEYLRERQRELLRNAAELADKKHWGTVPREVQSRVRELIKNKIDWRTELSDWFGTQFVSLDKHNTVRRINRKYPYQQPGKRRGHGLHLLVGCDQSASVDDRLLLLLGNELVGMADLAQITVVPFDYNLDLKNVQEWEPGSTPTLNRTLQGGTSFGPITKFANMEENRERFDLLLILTDGGAPKPEPSRIPRLWVLPEGYKLEFATDEKCIFVPLGD